MISIDSNILLYASLADSVWHHRAVAFLKEHSQRSDVAVSEFFLVEFYRLLRNPAIFKRPYAGAEAVSAVEAYRHHPSWILIGFPDKDSRKLHDQMWQAASKDDFAFRRIFDLRAALTLLQAGVTEFATGNVKDFEGFGFARVWNPLEGKS
jgi:toxin-antitoxin system PIN domain toxin